MKDMESPPASSDHGDDAFDSSKPFAGVVLCCTSIPPEQRVSAAPVPTMRTALLTMVDFFFAFRSTQAIHSLG